MDIYKYIQIVRLHKNLFFPPSYSRHRDREKDRGKERENEKKSKKKNRRKRER